MSRFGDTDIWINWEIDRSNAKVSNRMMIDIIPKSSIFSHCSLSRIFLQKISLSIVCQPEKKILRMSKNCMK